jgi:hypothetical protein
MLWCALEDPPPSRDGMSTRRSPSCRAGGSWQGDGGLSAADRLALATPSMSGASLAIWDVRREGRPFGGEAWWNDGDLDSVSRRVGVWNAMGCGMAGPGRIRALEGAQ